MAGDNRTPDKTIGEVKYAELKHAHERYSEKRNADGHGPGRRNAVQRNPDKPSPAGDNRTPDKVIGEVKYAQARQPPKNDTN